MHIRMKEMPTLFDWNQARAFLVTADAGSLSAAARRLGLTQPTLSRQVAALEEALGVTLFARVGKRLTLTQSGLDLLDHVRDMGDAASRFSLAASGQAQSAFGLVRITGSDLFSQYVLPPLLADLRRDHPGIEIELIASNAVQDLRRREADIAIRNVRPTQNDLIARQLAESPGHLYASPDWVARHGMPSRPSDLDAADWIWLDDPDEMMAYMAPFGITLSRSNFPVGTHSGIAYWALAQSGLGVAAMLANLARTSAPEMIPLCPDEVTIPVPFWLTTHAELKTSRRIRLVYDYLADRLPALLTA